MTEFRSFGKIARLNREVVVTEKIDGTNASVFIGEDGEFLTGSRTRWITPDDDNFGFSRWAHEHKDELMLLGPGHHFGEWWGKGIQRGYGLDERRFSLFNVGRWADSHDGSFPPEDTVDFRVVAPRCCHVVPAIRTGVLSAIEWGELMADLQENGSCAAPGFMKPEGIVAYHTAGGHYYKRTCEHDDEPKGARVKNERLPKPPRVGGIMWTGGRRKGATVGYAGPERRQG